MLKIQMHRTRHKISDLAGWSEWSKWEEGIGKTDDPTFEIEIENRTFFPDFDRVVAARKAHVEAVAAYNGFPSNDRDKASELTPAQIALKKG